MILTVAAFLVLAAQARLDVHFKPPNPSLSDTIELEITMSGASDSEAALLPADIPPDCVNTLNSGDESNRRFLTLDPLKPGRCHIPPFRTRCIGNATQGCETQSAETIIPIVTRVTGQDIRDTEEQPIELTPPPPDHSPALGWLWLLLIPLGAFLLRKWQRARKTPERRAKRRLKHLENPVAAHDVLRDYLDERLQLGARAASSPELLEALERRALCQGWAAKELRRFLAECDRAKFAAPSEAKPNVAAAAQNCRTLIQVIEFETTRRSRARV